MVGGAAGGDEVLLTTAHRLRGAVRPHDTVARLGGDEFAIITTRVTATDLTLLAHRVTDALAEAHLVHGQTITVTGSVGVHLAEPGQNATEVLHRADLAMYAVKRA